MSRAVQTARDHAAALLDLRMLANDIERRGSTLDESADLAEQLHDIADRLGAPEEQETT